MVAELQAGVWYFPHMCRDGHAIIGHKDSESELCPVCTLLAALESAPEPHEPMPGNPTWGARDTLGTFCKWYYGPRAAALAKVKS